MRHVFEDFLKLCDGRTGVLDMTRQSLSRRLNIPAEILDKEITKLESPDPASRDPEFDGRRIERIDAHRDWGWRILNWAKYDAVRTKADVYMRVAKHRSNGQTDASIFKKPTVEEVKLHFLNAHLPLAEAEKFFDYYESNGWRVGRNPMKNWHSAVGNWNRNLKERRYELPLKSGGYQKPNPHQADGRAGGRC